MSDHLYRLVYYSRSHIAERTALPQAIDDILRISRHNNAASGITGALMFNAACFGQVIEGPRAAVAALFERIQHDPRHAGVTLLAFDRIEARSFSNWSMGFVGVHPGDAAAFADVGRASGFDPSTADADALWTSMRDLALADEAGHR